jgi:hypothetical protein
MERALVIGTATEPPPGRIDRPTGDQRRALHGLGVGDESVRPAAFGPDVFAYVEDDHSTLRLQIAPDGRVVGQTVLSRGAGSAPGGGLR